MAQRIKNRKRESERIRDAINLNQEAMKLNLEIDLNDSGGNKTYSTKN